MLLDLKIRPYSDAVSGALFAISALLAGAFVPGDPIKIGYSMALTGGLAPNGKSALLRKMITTLNAMLRDNAAWQPRST